MTLRQLTSSVATSAINAIIYLLEEGSMYWLHQHEAGRYTKEVTTGRHHVLQECDKRESHSLNPAVLHDNFGQRVTASHQRKVT